MASSNQACVTVSAFWKQKNPKEAKNLSNQPPLPPPPRPPPPKKPSPKPATPSLWNGKTGKGPVVGRECFHLSEG